MSEAIILTPTYNAPDVRMKIYQSEFKYDYTFPAVTLAYFLRYPNPYAKHVLSTDVIDRHVDPTTNRLHTTRLHLKKSKVPAGILRFLPGGMAGPGGASQTFILETSTIDVSEGWLESESRNLEWTGVLSVIEKQMYRRRPIATETWMDKLAASDADIKDAKAKDQNWTTCKTTVTLVSRLGQAKKMARGKKGGQATMPIEEEAPKLGFFASWSTAGIQKTIELVGLKRTKTALVNGRTGMNIVLGRLRSGGIVGVLEGMRKDRAEIMAAEGGWKQVWQQGSRNGDDESIPRPPDIN